MRGSTISFKAAFVAAMAIAGVLTSVSRAESVTLGGLDCGGHAWCVCYDSGGLTCANLGQNGWNLVCVNNSFTSSIGCEDSVNEDCNTYLAITCVD